MHKGNKTDFSRERRYNEYTFNLTSFRFGLDCYIKDVTHTIALFRHPIDRRAYRNNRAGSGNCFDRELNYLH